MVEIDTDHIRPLAESPDDLYQKFLEEEMKHLDRISTVNGVTGLDQTVRLELAGNFEELVCGFLARLSEIRSKTSLSELDVSICKRHEAMLREERNTWRLARALFVDLLNDDQEMYQLDRYSSEQQIIAHFYNTNDEIRKMQVVIDWLEANASDDMDYQDEEDKAEFYAEGHVAWENTFHAIRSSTINGSQTLDLNMDPDAPFRNKTSLSHADKEVEMRLFKHLFKFIRSGQLDQGQNLAHRVGYYWLEGVLDGWKPYADPNIDDERTNLKTIDQPAKIEPTTGNKKRDIWLKTCFKAAKTQGLNSFEKAILGSLGGNLKSILPVCKSWSDHAWARLKCSIEVRIEKTLRDNSIQMQENKYLDFPQEFYDNDFDIADIFKSIDLVSPFKESTIHQTVQKLLIYNDIEGLLDQLQQWCKSLDYENDLASNCEALSPHFLRFFSHLVLFLVDMKQLNRHNEKAKEILKSYINLLTRLEYIEAVAFYAGFLPEDDQVIAYAHLLASINNIDERRECLAIAKNSHLNVDEITQTVVDMIIGENDLADKSRSGDNHNISRDKSSQISAHDRRKIEALDYLLLLESKNYLAILHQGSTLMRLFACERKLDSLRETFTKLPAGLNLTVENQWSISTGKEVPVGLRNKMRELEAYQILLETQELLREWSEKHHKRPEEPKKPANMAKFCDTLNFEKMVSQYHHDLAVWREQREMKTKELTKKIYDMFNYQGGWMVDLLGDNVQIEDIKSKERLNQLQKLRKLYIPQMTSVWINVLQLTEHYDECLALSHLIVDEKLSLYKEFSNEQLRDFLDKMKEIALHSVQAQYNAMQATKEKSN